MGSDFQSTMRGATGMSGANFNNTGNFGGSVLSEGSMGTNAAFAQLGNSTDFVTSMQQSVTARTG